VLLVWPALIIDEVGVPRGLLVRVVEQYPALTSAGVAMVYLIPAELFLFATVRWHHPP